MSDNNEPKLYGSDAPLFMNDIMEKEQIENLRIINLLKENLNIPFLFLCGGESHFVRRIGGELGCCMYLAVHEHDELATPAQPLLRDMKLIVSGIRGIENK